MTISDEDLKELKSCIYHDLAEMLRRSVSTPSAVYQGCPVALSDFCREMRLWAVHGGDPDLEEEA